MLGKVVWVAAVTAAVSLTFAAWFYWEQRFPDDASTAEFCDYWGAWGSPNGEDPLTQATMRAHLERSRSIGTPANASHSVREGLVMRIRLFEALADGGRQEEVQSILSLPTEEDREAWFAFEKYITETCR